MEVDMNILIEQMIIFFIIMCCGFIFTKIKLITPQMLKEISQLIMKLICPMMVLCIYPTAIQGANAGKITIQVMPFCALVYAVLAIFGYFLTILLGLKGDKRKIFIAQCQFGNLGFFGMPLVQEIFDVTGQIAFSFCIIVDSLFLWTEGVILASGSSGESKISFKEMLKKMANPVTIGMIVGLILRTLKVSPDNIVLKSFDTIGDCAKSMALIYIGGIIATMQLGDIKKAWPIIFVVILKMIVMPVAVFYIMTAFEASRAVVNALVLVLALPSMASLPVMARSFGSSESEYATQGVFIITLCSLLTIPLIVLLTK